MGGGTPSTPRMHKYRPWLDYHRSLWKTTRNHHTSQTGNIGSQTHPSRNNHTASRTSCTGCWTIPRKSRDTRSLMVRTTGDVRNTTREKVNGSGISQKIMESGPKPRQEKDEASIKATRK